jgi:hypothetical protein
MLREVKFNGKLAGYYEKRTGVERRLHVEWWFIDKDGKRQFGGAKRTVVAAQKAAKRRYAQERGEPLPAHLVEDLRPLCEVCGWRKGGMGSWDGKGCKCGHSEPPIPAP